MMSPRFARRWLSFLVLGALLAGAPRSPAQSPGKASPAPKPGPKVGAPPATAPYVLPATVATINGEPVKKQELETLATALVGSSGKALQDLSHDERKQVYASALDNIIVDRLASREATGEKVDDLDVEKRYGEMISQFPTPQDFEKQVRQSGQTTDQIRQNVRNQLAQQQWLQKQIAPDIKVTPEEVEKFYKESPPDKFDEPEVVHARHILIKARQDAPPEEAYLAEQKALKLADQIKKGEKFEDAAKESDDKSTRDKGGDLDWFTRDRIMPQFGDVAFRMKPGEVSAPVRTQFGYHLIQLLDHKPAHTATLGEASDQIASFIRSEKRQKAVTQAVENLRSKAKIETFLP